MKPGLFAAALMFFATPGLAQQSLPTTDASGAVLRGLDTMNGEISDIEIKTGETKRFERLEITLTQCRYPTEHPATDAFADLVIRDIREETPRFTGWMIASSPALSAMDHPRYDVWVLRCILPAPDISDGG